MTPTLTAPDPAVFPADVLAFAAARGVTEYLVPVYELTRRHFPGTAIGLSQQNDYEIADLGWIVFELAVSDWSVERYRAAQRRWIDEFLDLVPPAHRQPFILGHR